MLGFLRRRRRARVLAQPFPQDWRVRLELDVALWRAVPVELKPRLEDDLRVFVAERTWEPCGGLVLDDAMQAVIAAQACMLTLGRTVDALDHVRSILVYPHTYWAPDEWEDETGIVTEEYDQRQGEASEHGLVVLSWQEVVTDARTLNGRNLVLHEMAHQIDPLDGLPMGAGVRRAEAARWRAAFLALYDSFCTEVDAGRRVKGLDAYGAEDTAEFFAVATESFFERGAYLKANQPELYEMLAAYYALDPAAWPPPPRSAPADESGRARRRRRRAEERRLRRQERG